MENNTAFYMFFDFEQRLITDVKNKNDNEFKIRYNNCDISKEMLEKLKLFIGKVHLTDSDLRTEVFERRILEKEVNNDDHFCSELIADTYINMGLLTEKYPTNSYKPKDFSSAVILPLIKRRELLEGPMIDVS